MEISNFNFFTYFMLDRLIISIIEKTLQRFLALNETYVRHFTQNEIWSILKKIHREFK